MNKLGKQLERSFKKHSKKVLFHIKRGIRHDRWTYKQAWEDVGVLRLKLRSFNLLPGDKVLIWGPNSPEWSILFFACLLEGIIVVPVDARSGDDTLKNYKKVVKPKRIFVSKYLLPYIKSSRVVNFDELLFADEKKPVSLKERKLGSIAELIFTSGSTGNPKGVLISYENILAQMSQSLDMLPQLKRYETVSILPLSHVYEQMYGLFLPVLKGGTINYIERINPYTLKKELRRSRSTYLLVVPQMLRILYQKIEEEAVKKGKKRTFKLVGKYGSVLPMTIRRRVFSEVHKSFGGALEFFASGGSPLEPRLAEEWEAMGFPVIEGYGATETTGMVSVNNFKHRKLGTVGLIGDQCAVKIGSEGEILVKGKIVSDGYYQGVNSESFVSGWYKTGDTGFVDKEGFLTIKGRVSNRIVMSDGTKIYPEDIERHFNNHSTVLDSCVVGVGERFDQKLHVYLLLKKDAEIRQTVKEVNEDLEPYQQIFSYSRWPENDFPRLRTQKVDRNIVREYSQGIKLKGKGPVLDFSSVNSIIKSISGKSKIKDSDLLGKDLGLDSLQRILLAALVEEHFGVYLNDSVLTPGTSVSKIKKVVSSGASTANGFSAEEFLAQKTFTKNVSWVRKAVNRGVLSVLHGRYAPFVKIDGKEELDNVKKPHLFIFNHIGMFDFYSVIRALPDEVLDKTAIAVTSDRWEDGHDWLAKFIEFCMHGYPIASEGPWLLAGYEITGEMVNKGYSIIFSPEGRMQREHKPQPFLNGLGLLVRELRMPVIMFKISENYRDIWPPPPPEKSALTKEFYFPKKREGISVKIRKAKLPVGYENMNYTEITKAIEQQFKNI